MNNSDIFSTNPLQGIKLEQVVQELVDYYGWEILHAYLKINCLKSNPSMESTLKFLRKTEWAQIKVENFYLYKLKNLPKPDDIQYNLPPRDRIIPEGITPRDPCELSFSDAKKMHAKKMAKNKARERKHRSNDNNPWGR